MTEEPLRIDTDAVRQGGNEMLTGVTGLEMPPEFTPPTPSQTAPPASPRTLAPTRPAEANEGIDL